MKSTGYSRPFGPGEVRLWEKKAPLLSYLDLELTERCNFSCLHCYINLPAADRKAKAKELSAERIKAILEEAASLGCLKVRFTGGEPLLRSGFRRTVHLHPKARPQGRHFHQRLPHHAPIGGYLRPNPAPGKDRSDRLRHEQGLLREGHRGPRLLRGRMAGHRPSAGEEDPLCRQGSVPFGQSRKTSTHSNAGHPAFPGWTSAPPFSQHFNLRCRRDSDKKNRLIKGLRLPAGEGLEFLLRNESAFLEEMRGFCSNIHGSRRKQALLLRRRERQRMCRRLRIFLPLPAPQGPGDELSFRKRLLEGRLDRLFPEDQGEAGKEPGLSCPLCPMLLEGIVQSMSGEVLDGERDPGHSRRIPLPDRP